MSSFHVLKVNVLDFGSHYVSFLTVDNLIRLIPLTLLKINVYGLLSIGLTFFAPPLQPHIYPPLSNHLPLPLTLTCLKLRSY